MNELTYRTQWLIGSVCVALLAVCTLTLADGNIDPVEKYGWSEGAGWVSFSPSNGGVTVTLNSLSGYAWSENVGWIKLGTGSAPYANTTSANWGVNVDAAARLSGFAWSEGVGWIKFDAGSGQQVTIDKSTGRFNGYAWAENLGWIHFQSASPVYSVRTTAGLISGTILRIM